MADSCRRGRRVLFQAGIGFVQKEIGPPIREVKPLPELGLLVFRDDTSLFAYGRAGMERVTERISLDNLTIETVEGHLLRGRALISGGREADDYVKWVDYEVDLWTGKHKGGQSG